MLVELYLKPLFTILNTCLLKNDYIEIDVNNSETKEMKQKRIRRR